MRCHAAGSEREGDDPAAPRGEPHDPHQLRRRRRDLKGRRVPGVRHELARLGHAGPEVAIVQGGATYSDIQGGHVGEGNIDANPLWAGALGGNYNLTANSPFIDAGRNRALPQDASDLDTDANTFDLLPLDYNGNPRMTDNLGRADTGCGGLADVNLGAIETADVNGPEIIPGDANEDGQVNFAETSRRSSFTGDSAPDTRSTNHGKAARRARCRRAPVIPDDCDRREQHAAAGRPPRWPESATRSDGPRTLCGTTASARRRPRRTPGATRSRSSAATRLPYGRVQHRTSLPFSGSPGGLTSEDTRARRRGKIKACPRGIRQILDVGSVGQTYGHAAAGSRGRRCWRLRPAAGPPSCLPGPSGQSAGTSGIPGGGAERLTPRGRSW